MLDHVSLGSRRYADAVAFYREVLAPLGVALVHDTGREAAFGPPPSRSFYVYAVAEGGPPLASEGTHLAFAAPSRAAVSAAYDAAQAAAGGDISSPRLRPDINDTYFGAMFSDLDGHRIEIVTHAPT